MSDLRSIVDQLSKQANANANRAYLILGARPGPGLDIMIRPVEPLCGKWFIDGRTQAGKNFVAKFWSVQPVSNQSLSEFRKQALDWQLTYQTEIPTESIIDNPGIE